MSLVLNNLNEKLLSPSTVTSIIDTLHDSVQEGLGVIEKDLGNAGLWEPRAVLLVKASGYGFSISYRWERYGLDQFIGAQNDALPDAIEVLRKKLQAIPSRRAHAEQELLKSFATIKEKWGEDPDLSSIVRAAIFETVDKLSSHILTADPS